MVRKNHGFSGMQPGRGQISKSQTPSSVQMMMSRKTQSTAVLM